MRKGPAALAALIATGLVLTAGTAAHAEPTTINVGGAPIAAVVSPDGATVYISDGSFRRILAVSTATNEVTHVRDLYYDVARSMAVSPDSSTVYAVQPSIGTLVALSSTMNYKWGISVAGEKIALNPAGSQAYVASKGLDQVSVISTSLEQVTQTITVSGGPADIAVSPDGSKIYTANSTGDSVSVISADTNTVLQTITVGDDPEALAVAANGDVYVANTGDNTVSVIAAGDSARVRETVSVGFPPTAIAYNAKNGDMYVVNATGDTVSLLSTTTDTIVRTAQVGTEPSAVAISPVTGVAYVTNSGDGTITVLPLPKAPVFMSDTPPLSATVGSTYSYTFTASGEPAPTFSVDRTGGLPDGLTLSSAGVLSGTPTSAETATFTVRASNGVGEDAVTGSISIRVSPRPEEPAFTADSPPTSSTVGVAYSYTFTADGYPAPTFSVGAGRLPAGLTLTSAGVLSGTPSGTDEQTFTVVASNGVGTDATTDPITITTSEPLVQPSFVTPAPPSTVPIGQPYSYTFAAAGNPAPTFTVDSGQLPAGLSLSADGALTGTPTSTGTWTFTVAASNGVGQAVTTEPITIVIAAASPSSGSGSDQGATSMNVRTAAPVATPVRARADFAG